MYGAGHAGIEAILVGVLLARRFQDASAAGAAPPQAVGALLREAFLNGPVFLLIGSLLASWWRRRG